MKSAASDVEVGAGSSGDDTHTFSNIISTPFDIDVVPIGDVFMTNDDIFGGLSPTGDLLQRSASMPVQTLEIRKANSASARKYRARKRQEMENLKEKCKSYESCNMELQIMLQKSMKKIDELKKEIRKLRESSEQ